MNSANDAIGGYFELELTARTNDSPMVNHAIELNSARNCLEYILETKRPSKVYIPKYTCDVILEPFQKTGVAFEYYSVDLHLELSKLPVVHDDEMILYTNYFGIKNKYIAELLEYYKSKLIIDASQAFFYQPDAVTHIFYSPRKFFGVPDGGYLVTNQKLTRHLEPASSHDRMSHLLKRLELPAEEGYEDFVRNDKSLEGQPILSMSVLTNKLLGAIDYIEVGQKRKENFKFLHEALSSRNELNLLLDDNAVPMVYPYLIKNAGGVRGALIDQRIFVATYWPSVLDVCREDEVESYLVRGILPLPIDQRYGVSDMKRIIEVIDECND